MYANDLHQHDRREARRGCLPAPHVARVVRDGYAVDLPMDDIVPGDVVLLSAGSLVPADGVT